MTQANLLELAKQGDPQAIAALMNQSLQSKGMIATVERQGDELEVILEAERVPNRQALTAFVQQGIHNLGMQSIRSIRILGQQIGAGSPAWMQELIVDSATAGTPLTIQPETETLEQPNLETELLDKEAGTDLGESVTAMPGSLEELLMESELPTEPSLSLEEQLKQLELAELPADDESSAELAALWNQQSQAQPDDFLQELLIEPTDLAADEPVNSEVTPAADLSEAALGELLGEPDANFQSASADSDAELLDFFNELSDGTSTDTAFPSEPTQTESTLAEDWFSGTPDDSAVPSQDWFIESSEGVVETSRLDAALSDESMLDESELSESVSESSESTDEAMGALDGAIADLLSSDFPADLADDATPEFALTDFATEEVAPEQAAHPTGQPDAEWIGFLGEADSADSNEPLEPPDFLFDLESETTAGSPEPFMAESPEFSDEALQEWFSNTSDAPDTVEGALEAELSLAEVSDSAAADEGLLDFLDTLSDPRVSPEATPQDPLPEVEAAFSADTHFETDLDLQTGLGDTPTADSPVDYSEESVLAWDGSELVSSESSESDIAASSEVEPLESATSSEWLMAPFVTPEPPEELPPPAPQSPLLQEELFGVDSAPTDWEPTDFPVASSEEQTDAAAPEAESTLEVFSSRAAETEAEAQFYDQIDSLFAAEPETSEFAGFSEETVFEQPVTDMPPELAQNWLGETAASLDLSQPQFFDSAAPESTQDPNAAGWMNPQEFTAASEFPFGAEEPQPPAELLQEFSWDEEESVAATPSVFTESAFTESTEFTVESADFPAAEWSEELPEEFAAALIEPPLLEEPVAYSFDAVSELDEVDAVDEIIAPPDFLLEMSEELSAAAPATQPPSDAAFDAFQFNEAASDTALEDDLDADPSEPNEAAFFAEPAGERIAEITAEDFNWDMLADPLSPQDTSLGFSEADFSFDEFSFADSEPPLSVNADDVTETDPLNVLLTDEPTDGLSEAAIGTADAVEETPEQGLDEAAANPDLSDLFAQQEPGWDAVLDSPESASPESTPQPEDFLTDAAPEATASGDEPLFSANLPASAEATDRTEDMAAAPRDPDATVDRNISQDSLEAGLGDFREGFVEQPLPSELLLDDSTGALDWEQELQDAFVESDSAAELTDELEEPLTATVYPPNESIDQPDQPSSYPLVPVAAEPAPLGPEAATMPSNMAQTLPAGDSRSPSWLFGLVLLLLAGWLAGLLGFSLLWSRVAPPAAPDAPEPPAAPTDSP